MKYTGPFCCFRNAVPTTTVDGIDLSLYGHYICGHGITTKFFIGQVNAYGKCKLGTSSAVKLT